MRATDFNVRRAGVVVQTGSPIHDGVLTSVEAGELDIFRQGRGKQRHRQRLTFTLAAKQNLADGAHERVRRERDPDALSQAMQRFENAARDGRENLMPYIVESVRAYATLGEQCGVLREVFGEYREPAAV